MLQAHVHTYIQSTSSSHSISRELGKTFDLLLYRASEVPRILKQA